MSIDIQILFWIINLLNQCVIICEWNYNLKVQYQHVSYGYLLWKQTYNACVSLNIIYNHLFVH